MGKISLIAAAIYGGVAYHDASNDAGNHPSTPISAFWGYRLVTTAPDFLKGIRVGFEEVADRDGDDLDHAYGHGEHHDDSFLPWQEGQGAAPKTEI